MTTSSDFASPVHLKAVSAPGQPTVTPALEELYRGFEQELLIPLWTEIGDLMPDHPRSKALPHLLAVGRAAGPRGPVRASLVPVGRGGERRRDRARQPGLGGRPFATPTLWAAIQYLLPGENAPSTGTPSTPSGSCSRARASGPSSAATRWRCAGATSARRRG